MAVINPREVSIILRFNNTVRRSSGLPLVIKRRTSIILSNLREGVTSCIRIQYLSLSLPLVLFRGWSNYRARKGILKVSTAQGGEQWCNAGDLVSAAE